LPLPAGADTTLTRACVASRPNSRGRDTTPPAPRPAAPPATASAPATNPIMPIIAPHQPKWPAASGQSRGRGVVNALGPVHVEQHRGELAHVLKYFASGWCTTIASVDCSGCS